MTENIPISYNSRNYNPETKLWTFVLNKAIDDLSSKSDQVRESALRWFLNQDFHINTFCGICFTLNYDLEKVRNKILRTHVKEKDLKKFLEVNPLKNSPTPNSSNSLTMHSPFIYPDEN